MKRTAIVTGTFLAITALGVAPASAAPNPSGTGQPGAECGSDGATSMPAGFNTDGFANAEAHYAGSDGTPSLNSDNAHAVSQYDIACYQITQAHG
jgi:hypothetical protein